MLRKISRDSYSLLNVLIASTKLSSQPSIKSVTSVMGLLSLQFKLAVPEKSKWTND